jgi:ABC-type branched-subunit amino acid transport system substrate-binding protein
MDKKNNIVVEEMDERRRKRRRRRGQQQQEEENISEDTATTIINDNVDARSAARTTLESQTAQTTSSVSSSSSLSDNNDSSSNSHILRINADTRLAHLAAFLPLTSWSSNDDDTPHRALVDFRVYLQVSVYLAWHHLQHPHQNHVLPDITAERLQGCDLQFSLQLHDSQFSPLQAARQLLHVLMQTKAQVKESSTTPLSSTTGRGRRRATAAAETTSYTDALFYPNALAISPMPVEGEDDDEFDNNSTTAIFEAPPAQRIISRQAPMAIMGAARSAVTATLSTLSSVYGIPQIAGSSTASILDDKSRHPLLARTVPTNAGDARAAVLYLQHLTATATATSIQHLAVLYIGDDFGTNYHAAIVREASLRHVSIRSIQYTTEQSMDAALLQLQESGMRYVLAILDPQSWKQLLALAARLNLAGPGTGYTWFLTEANLVVANPEFALTTKSNPQDALVARALHGAGIVLIHIPDHAAMDQALQDFRNDAVLQQDFASLYRDDDEAKMLLLQNFTYPSVGRSFYQYLYYDAIMALGIAACETTSRDLFTGQDLYQQLRQTEFQGVSGPVSFDPLTGTRRAENFQFRVVNLIRQDNDDDNGDGLVRFQTQIVALVHPPNDSNSNNATGMSSATNGNEIVELLAPFVYADSTTRVPVDLSPLVEDWNLITPAFRGVGLTLGLLAMMSSIGWMIWTLCHRKKDVVQSSQPFFLVQLCIGTFVMSSAIIPLSLQEPVSDRVLDMCCMMVPW